MNLGTLNVVPAIDRLDLVAKPVADALSRWPNQASLKEIGIVEIDPQYSDSANFCEQFKVDLQLATNCVIVEARRGDQRWFAAVLIPASSRADINGIARRTLGARSVSFAPMEVAVRESGMEYGGITPIGLPGEWPLLIDAAVMHSDVRILGAGKRCAKLVVPGNILKELPSSVILENLARI